MIGGEQQGMNAANAASSQGGEGVDDRNASPTLMATNRAADQDLVAFHLVLGRCQASRLQR